MTSELIQSHVERFFLQFKLKMNTPDDAQSLSGIGFCLSAVKLFSVYFVPLRKTHCISSLQNSTLRALKIQPKLGNWGGRLPSRRAAIPKVRKEPETLTCSPQLRHIIYPRNAGFYIIPRGLDCQSTLNDSKLERPGHSAPCLSECFLGRRNPTSTIIHVALLILYLY
jgi:hypothetical protein